MRKDGRNLIFLLSILLLIFSVATFLGFINQTIKIDNTIIFLDKLAVAFTFFGIGGLIYYFWG